MSKGLSESQFYMWRTLFAVAHADDIVTDEEVRFMAEALEDIPFSNDQRAVLNEDAKHQQDAEKMFCGITDVHDQAAFFKLAHVLVHVDGDYGVEEQAVMLKLKELHLQHADLDDLIGGISMELEEDDSPESAFFAAKQGKETEHLKKTVYSFRDAFLEKRFNKRPETN